MDEGVRKRSEFWDDQTECFEGFKNNDKIVLFGDLKKG